MAHKLDQSSTYETYDKEDIGYGVEHLPEQFLRATEDVLAVAIPASYKSIERVVLMGMGGSHLAMRMIKDVSFKERKKPIEIVSDYALPGYVNNKTLVILSSFSGTTEEVLEAAKAVQKTKAKVFVLTSGGPLAELGKKKKWPMYRFTPGELAKQPRLGLGFPFVGLAHVLKACGVIAFSKKQLDSMVDAMIDVVDACAIETNAKENPAKQVANALAGRPVLIVAAEHLVGNAHILQNQINETAKSYCHYHPLPELNHHFLESLVLPEGFFGEWTVLLIKSKQYHPRTQKRFELTAALFEQRGAEVVEYHANGKTLWDESAEVLQFGSYLSYYLAMLHEVEPQHIPFVDALKAQLK